MTSFESTRPNKHDTPNAHGTQRPLTGYHVGAMIVAFFAVIIAANATMAWFASDSWSGLVVKNGYVASQQYNAKIAAANLQKARGWRLKFKYSNALLSFSLTDKDNLPVYFDKIVAKIGRPVSYDNDVEMALVHKGRGLYQAKVELSKGIWSFRLDAHGDKPYRSQGRFFVSDKGIGKLQDAMQ